MDKDSEDALAHEYDRGFEEGQAQAEEDFNNQLEEAQKESFDEGYAEGLKYAIKAIQRLQ